MLVLLVHGTPFAQQGLWTFPPARAGRDPTNMFVWQEGLMSTHNPAPLFTHLSRYLQSIATMPRAIFCFSFVFQVGGIPAFNS